MKQAQEFSPVGRVAAIYRYPVKSMRGQALPEGAIGWHGLAGDRRYAFVQTSNFSSFPWLTGREIAPLLLYTPFFADPSHPATSKIVVKTPAGRELAIESAELVSELVGLYGEPAHLVQSNRGNFDSMPVSVITRATLKALGEKLGQTFEGRHFRQNIVIENYDGEAFGEESWLHNTLTIGEGAPPVTIRASRQIERCMMINLDPETAHKNPAVLREVAQNRANCLGIFGPVLEVGRIKVGMWCGWLKAKNATLLS